MRKKIVSLFSAAALFITLVCTVFVNAAAAGAVKVTAATNLTTVKQGNIVRVDLNLTENPGLISIHLKVNYDPDVFEFSKVENKNLFGSSPTFLPADDEGCYRVNWLDYVTEENLTQTGLLASVYFKVKDTAENGNYEFVIGAVEEDITDYDFNQLPISFENASVKVNDGLSDDATLKSLTVLSGYGTLSPEFDPAVEAYTVAVPYGKGIPKITAVKNDAKATVQITQATGYESGKNEATVTVTAENKKTVKTYKVTFTEINAMLSTLTVNGTAVSGFDPDTTSYTYSVPYADWNTDKNKTYTIAATASKDTSTVEIGENDFTLTSTDPDTNSDKNATVTVTADNGTKTVYTIKFTVLACQHNYVKDDAQSTPATCETAGEDVSVCDICGKEKTETVKALGHDLGPWTTVAEATCEADGSQTQTCSRCGNVVNTKIIPKKGHRWGGWHPVEGSENTYERICANGCAQSPEIHTVADAADGHIHAFNGQTEVITPATCTVTGQQKRYCSVDDCNEWIPETIETIPHTEAERIVKESTCTEEGEKVVYCSVCNTELSRESIEMIPHNYGSSWANDSTSHWHECTMCGNKTDEESHTENGGVITTPATNYSSGTKTYSCTVCGYVMRTETIPAVSNGDDSYGNYPRGENNGVPVIPFGGIKTTESMTVSVENKITGEKSTARAQRSGDSVTVRLGAENDGNYANFYTTNDEYIYSAVIENGRAKLNVSSDVKIKVIIDSIAYGEDVSSEAAADGEASEIVSGNTIICLMSVVLIAGAAVMTVFIKKRTNK